MEKVYCSGCDCLIDPLQVGDDDCHIRCGYLVEVFDDRDWKRFLPTKERYDQAQRHTKIATDGEIYWVPEFGNEIEMGAKK